MTLLQLQYALECTSTGSINKAAENTFTTPSNLSKMLKSLEDELGYALFVRNTNGVVTTPNGEAFFQHANTIMVELEHINDIAKMNHVNKIVVTSQSNPYCCAAFAELINNAEGTGTPMNYTLYVCSDTESIELLKTGQCDVVVLEMPMDYEKRFLDQITTHGLKSERITKVQVYVIINKEHPALLEWTPGEPFTFSKLRDYPCVGYPKRGYFELSYNPRYLPDMVDPNNYIEVNNYPWRDTLISRTNAFAVGFFAPQSLLESKHLTGIPIPDAYGHLFCLTSQKSHTNPMVQLFTDKLRRSLDEPGAEVRADPEI